MNKEMEERFKDLKQGNKEKRFTRYFFMICIMSTLFLVILTKLTYLQIFNVDYYRNRANDERHDIISYTAPRGKIYDAEGNILATNKQGYSLTYTRTKENDKHFFKTLEEVFGILHDNDEKLAESFALKVDPIRFEYNVQSSDMDWADNRFKDDRGLSDYVRRELFPGENMADLDSEQKAQIKSGVLKLTPEFMFRYLIKKYDLYNMIKDDYSEERWKEMTKDSEAIDKLVEILMVKVPLEEIRRYMIVKDTISMQSFSRSKTVTIANDIEPDTAYVFEQIQMELPGISVQKGPIRYYPNGDLASGVIGNIGKINDAYREDYEQKGYSVHEDYMGKEGIEGKFEEYLKGTRGEESIEVNKEGRKVKSLGEKPATPGDSIYLTLDSDMQRAAEKALDDTMAYVRELGPYKANGDKDDVDKSNATRGAAVVIEVKTGRVLALASRPGVDLNLFTVQGRLDNEMFKTIFNPDLEEFGRDYIERNKLYENENVKGIKASEMEKEEAIQAILDELFAKDSNGRRTDKKDIYPKPIFNYATSTSIPPGSVFKVLTAVAGLEEGVITPNEKIYDAGPYRKRYKDFSGASWMYNVYRGSHGNQNVKEAIRDSNNYYFFEVADRLFEKGEVGSKNALDSIAKYAWKFGLGADMEGDKDTSYSGIEINEKFGQVYYYDYGKRIISVQITRKLYQFMKMGTTSILYPTYKPIDIIPYDSDSEEVYKIKKDLTAAIKVQMRSEEKPDYSRCEELLRLLVDKISSKENPYKESDIQGMIKAIASSTNDARTEIRSGVNLYNASIGQGMNQFTPIQLANYIATLVNGGHRYSVRLVDKIVNADGEIVEDFTDDKNIINETDVSKETIDVVKEGMKMVTSTPGGTAYSTFGKFPISSGGKTGSSTFENDQEEYGRTSYATYVGFAPFEDPEIAVSVVIFDGGHGGYSARVAKAVYESYFRDRILDINPEYEFAYPEETDVVPEGTKTEGTETEAPGVEDSKKENSEE